MLLITPSTKHAIRLFVCDYVCPLIDTFLIVGLPIVLLLVLQLHFVHDKHWTQPCPPPARSRRCDNILRILGSLSRPTTAFPARPELDALQNGQRVALSIRGHPILCLLVSTSKYNDNEVKWKEGEECCAFVIWKRFEVKSVPGCCSNSPPALQI